MGIDRDEYISCGNCWDTCPDVFEENIDDQLSQVIEQYRAGGDIAVGEVPDTFFACAQDAADSHQLDFSNSIDRYAVPNQRLP